MNQHHPIFGISLSAIAGLAFLDGTSEGGPVSGLIGASLGLIVPAACIAIVMRRDKAGKASTASKIGAIIVSLKVYWPTARMCLQGHQIQIRLATCMWCSFQSYMHS